ncbi:MAG: signal peptidase I [Candidatus Aminicenantes bacterium]|nr:signal peptidase I [Candidatus Aminicenantes bacterium]
MRTFKEVPITETKPVEKKKRTKSVFREYFELIVETAVFVFFVMTFVVQAFQIPTGSMEPTLLVGDFLLVNKFVYDNGTPPIDRILLPRREIKRKDIIVFKFPNNLSKDYVKRAIGLPGEKIEIRDKQVFVNDQPLDEAYKVHIFNNNENSIRDNFGPVTVPPDQLFAMGDNRDNSEDSRYWGFVPLSYIKGRPWVIYFSYEAEKNAYKKTSLGDRLKKLVQFIPKARWGRMLKIIH